MIYILQQYVLHIWFISYTVCVTSTDIMYILPTLQSPKRYKYVDVIQYKADTVQLRPSFMGIVFGVYWNWIWEFGDLKSDTPILRGSIWPNTIISNPIFVFFLRFHRIWVPNTMESRTIVFAVFDLTCRRVPLKVRSHRQA